MICFNGEKLMKKKQKKFQQVYVISLMSIIILVIVGCTKKNPIQNKLSFDTQNTEKPLSSTLIDEQEDQEQNPAPENVKKEEKIFINVDGKTIRERIILPDGFTRIAYDTNSFGEFIRNYDLLLDGSPVLLYDGSEKSKNNAHIAVFDMNLSKRDLQQCADSIMRMYAEYYWFNEQYDKIAFHFVNGFLCSYDKWRNGSRIQINGNQIEWHKTANVDLSWEVFEKYLDTVFAYASTLSMKEESEPADLNDMEIGDVFLYSGSPDHVVMVVDVCVNEIGEKAFLLAQGYMPAQQFHILKNPLYDNDPWYYLSELTWPFQTPEYTFQEDSFRKMKY